jgi:hypothetical protein
MFAATSYSAIGLTSATGSYSGFRLTLARGEPNDAIDISSYSAIGLSSFCRFKPNGRGQRARRALLSSEMVTKAKAQIEATLGELALFEPIMCEV